MATIGKVQVKEIVKTEFTFEWRIKDFFSLSSEEGKSYNSPKFSIDGEYWYLSVNPNGEKRNNSVGYISIYFHRLLSGPSKCMSFSLGIKTVDGQKDCENHDSYVFTKSYGWGFVKILQRSKLMEKSTLVPDGVLTIVLTTESCNKSNYDAESKVKPKCSHCKQEFDRTHISIHEQECQDRPTECPTCKDSIPFKKFSDHECVKERVRDTAKLVDDFKTIFESEDHSDVTIKVKNVEFRLHRNILAGRNVYFCTMFRNEMQEKRTGIVLIDDCEPDIFRSFACFLYTGKLDDISVQNVCGLYEVAEKYQENQLKAKCLAFLIKEISVETFCDFIVLALKYGEEDLLQHSTNFFCRNAREIIQSAKWRRFLRDYPTQANDLHLQSLN